MTRRYVRSDPNATTRECSHCREVKSVELFQRQNGRANGWCRDCRYAANLAYRRARGERPKRFSHLEDGRKLCMKCSDMKPLAEFSPAKRGLGGVAAYCRPCASARIVSKPGFREKNRAATAEYRRRHRARHLANHRIRMWERRNRAKVQADGTATTEFLEALYAESVCHYCRNPTPEDDRTADHKTPLSRGGPHSAANLVMACWSCNCSKRDKTE